MAIPTLDQMVKAYLVSADVERLKCGRPGKDTVSNTLQGVKIFRRWFEEHREALGCERLDGDSPSVSVIRPPLIHGYLSDLLKSNLRPITALSYVNQFRQLFARWVRPYYDDRGWNVPDFPRMGSRPRAPRYIRPSAVQLRKVKDWYLSLLRQGKTDLWFVATMMLEFGMRNNDILRLRRDNFVESGGRVFLNYTPHKTLHSSGRVVRWPVHEAIWATIRGYGFGYDEESFVELNRAMRGLGFTGNKGAYELRKICIDHVYQKFGAEMAVSISGDNIRTILHYYADPAQPNVGEIRIADLI